MKTEIKNGAERTFYPNGKIESEVTYINGNANGVTRRWHSNGVLASEIPVKDNLTHGVCRFWNDKNELLGSYEMKEGTGIFKQWYPNGKLRNETNVIQGMPVGRMRCWDESGELIVETYSLKGRQLSKRKYLEACAKDPTLPSYEQDGKKPSISEDDLPSTKYRKRKSPVTDKESKLHAETIAKFRAKPNQAEAREWLAGNKTRNVGEMMPEAAREVIDEGYKAGADKIIAVNIQDETTNYLIVELPTKLTKRKRVFEWSNELAQESGFDPEEDWGQSELFIFFD